MKYRLFISLFLLKAIILSNDISFNGQFITVVNNINKSSFIDFGYMPKTYYSYNLNEELVFDLDLDLNNIAAGDSLFLEFTSFSEEAYNYMYSVIRSQNSFVSPFGTEPVSVYSNIENGIGIFMGANILDTLLVP